MTDRPAFNSFGEVALDPNGPFFGQKPLSLYGRMGKAVEIAYLALLEAWDGLTKTDIKRKALLDLINEKRAERELKPITDKRTVTWYFTILRKLKVIGREYDREQDAWVTTHVMVPRGVSKLPDAMPAVKNAETASTAKGFHSGQIKVGELFIEQMKSRGLEPILDETAKGGVYWRRLEGVDYAPVQDLKARAIDLAPIVKAILEASRPARE